MPSDSDPFKGWYDISSESYREYVSESGTVYRIDNPQKFFRNKVSGTHYVLDSEGVVHTLLASAFMVLRFLDSKGVSFTTTRDGDTVRV
ncbi:MAG: hypothetical protein ACTHJR_11650 [Sphingomonas sp.]|uniref:hypothetical protein n=1 Tax=Sphingomonas sp. TaxID=28214 RepID=UPI003F80916E